MEQTDMDLVMPNPRGRASWLRDEGMKMEAEI
jgi:hypothetical protein